MPIRPVFLCWRLAAALVGVACALPVRAQDSPASGAAPLLFDITHDQSPPFALSSESLAVQPADAAAPWISFESRLRQVEDELARNHAIAAPLPARTPPRPTFKISGLLQLDYWAYPHASTGIGFFENPNPASAQFGQDPEDRFLFRRVRLDMEGDILDPMLWRIQIDLANPNDPVLRDVYVGFKDLPGNQTLLVGNQKRPLGLDHLNSSRFNVFMERPLVVDAFNDDNRRPGICLYGHTDAGDYHWRTGVFLLENIANSDGQAVGDLYQSSINARLSASPWYADEGRNYFHWAVSGMVARPDGDDTPQSASQNEAQFRARPEARTNSRWLDTGPIAGAVWYEVLGLEAIYNRGPLQVTAEYQFNWVQRDATTPGTGPDVHFHGAYVFASWFVTGEHIPYTRDMGIIGRVVPRRSFAWGDHCCDGPQGWGAWELAVRYSYLDLTDADIAGGRDQSLTAGVNWHWTAYSKLQLEAGYGQITGHAPVGGFTRGDYSVAAMRFSIDF